jgi:secreted trypsin-like serine protease
VVAVLDATGKLLCSATLIGTSRGRSAFLSAAHCLDFEPTHVAVGNDYGSPEQLLLVTGALTDPVFDHATGGHDFAVIRTEEAARGLEPVRLARSGSREVQPGRQVRFVGFGGGGEEAVTSRERREVLGTVDAVSADSFEYAQAEGGPCLGDSGGPALGVGADADVLLGVTSFGDHGCRSRGTSARIQAAHDFLASELDEPPPACGD